ncbi:hypothetical protein DPMN_026578 [Dreissena polymorpha]|uniref:Uncharacterized protein n=1 Tax=Dreissena polymorpha TaxID=45954 RepID=A0A9D4LSV6_DREPO|nr:hypothetical protein DPMN_026578 [Dreissena polymorpha]
MPIGAPCSSEVFQRKMEKHFEAMDGVEIVVCGILVHGNTIAEHNLMLRAVLEKSKKH